MALPGFSTFTLQWSIGTTPFAADLAAGTATPSVTFLNPATKFNLDLYQASFPLSATLAPGTYWLTLTSDTVFGNGIHWDVTNGPSAASFESLSRGIFDPSIASESFQLFGSSVPEPASITLLGLGIAAMAGYRWRRKQATA
jgi:hypothetical protein